MSSITNRDELSPEMTLREKIAQLIFVRIGSNLPPILRVEEDEERVARLLRECHVGGLLLFNGGMDTKESLERLQAFSKVPLLVASDVERGVGQQVKGYTLFPHAMAFGRVGPALLESFIESLAQESRDVGIHITFGPVADVNTNPDNPIISIRAFSEDPDTTSDLTTRFVSWAENRGLLTTAKHFPGHGSTAQDSHDSAPSVSRSLAELRECELPPFQAAIDADCSLIMTAHVAFPSVDPSGLPATLSPKILQQLLREEMGFKGAICSDSLLMAGVRDRFASEGEMALATLKAGVDLLLDLHEPAAVVDYLADCVETGELDEARVHEAFAQVWALKRKVFEQPPAQAGATPRQSSAASAASIAKDAIQVLADSGAPLPFSAGQPVTAILLKPFETPLDPPEQPLAAAMRERFREVQYAQLGPKADAIAYAAARELARHAEQLLVAMVVRPAAWHAYGLRDEQRELIGQLVGSRPLVLASLGAPYELRKFPGAAARICTYSDVPVSQQALADVLAGGT